MLERHQDTLDIDKLPFGGNQMTSKHSPFASQLASAPHPLRSQLIEGTRNQAVVQSSIAEVIEAVLEASELLWSQSERLKRTELELQQLKLAYSRVDLRLIDVESELAEQTQRAETAESRIRELEDR